MSIEGKNAFLKNTAERISRDLPGDTPQRRLWRMQDESERLAREEKKGLARERLPLIVGGAGYIGCMLARDLLDRGYRVRILDNFLYGTSLSLEGMAHEENLEIIRGDVRDPAARALALEGVTDVILLASLVGDPISKKYPELTREVNVDASKALFDDCRDRGIHKFVFTSTCSNYGLQTDDKPVTEFGSLNPLSVYAETKVEFEKYILANYKDVDFAPVILRLATAFGESARMRFDLTVNEFAFDLARGRPLKVFDKDTWRPYCHVLDICDIIVRAMEAPADKVRGEVFNTGADENNFTKAMVVEQILRRIPGEVEYVEGGFDARNYRVSFAKVQSVLEFRANHSVEAFLERFVPRVQQGLYARADAIPDYYKNLQVIV